MEVYVFLLYLLLILCVGIFSYRRTKSVSDFSIGDRRLPFFVLALSEKASDFSAWLLLGLPGLAYADPLAALWAGVGCMVGTIFNWIFIAEKVRSESFKTQAITFPEFLSRKSGEKGNTVKFISVVVISIFFLFYISAQLMGIGKVLNVVFGLSPRTGMLLGFGIVILYTTAGGFVAVSWTDFFQSLFMIFGLAFLCSSMLIKSVETEFVLKGTTTAMMIANFSIAFGYPGQPHILMRYMALNSKRDVKRAGCISILWTFFALAFAIGIGWLARYVSGVEGGDRELISLLIAKKFMPALFFGIMASAVVSASMSTVDSQLLVLTTSISHDLLGKKLKGEQELLLSRAFTVLLSLLALLFAFTAREFVYWLVLYAWSGLASSFGPPLLLLLYWKRVNRYGVIAGMITGTLTTIVWHNIPVLREAMYELVPAFFFSLFSVAGISILTKPGRGGCNK